MEKYKTDEFDANAEDIRLFIPLFLLKKLSTHPLTNGLFPVSLGRTSAHSKAKINQPNTKSHWLIYCHQMEGKLIFQNKSRTVKHGNLVTIPPNTAFQFRSTNQTQQQNKSLIKSIDNGAIYWINFDGCLASDFAQRLLMKMDNGLANVGSLPNIISGFDNLLALGQRGYTATNVIHAVHVLQQSLSFLALQLRLTAFNKSSKLNIEAIETLMRNNLHQELSLDDLASHAQLSKFHFAKRFKELTDNSPIQHFINMKIQYACNKLDNSDIAIKVIASEIGYNDPYYFSRLFKKMIGVSPKQFRDSRVSNQ